MRRDRNKKKRQSVRKPKVEPARYSYRPQMRPTANRIKSIKIGNLRITPGELQNNPTISQNARTTIIWNDIVIPPVAHRICTGMEFNDVEIQALLSDNKTQKLLVLFRQTEPVDLVIELEGPDRKMASYSMIGRMREINYLEGGVTVVYMPYHLTIS